MQDLPNFESQKSGSPSTSKTDEQVAAYNDPSPGSNTNHVKVNVKVPQPPDPNSDKCDEEEESPTEDEEEPTTEDSDPEEWNSSDESETEAMLDVYESRFLALLDQRISDTEKLFDNPDLILRVAPPQKNHSVQKTPPPLSTKLTTEASMMTMDKDTQTDFGNTMQTVGENQSVFESSGETCSQLYSEEKAREEIGHLRTAKESLLIQRQELAKKVKQSTEHDPGDERKLFEFDEATDAIDSCIEFKNEIICGRQFVFNNLLVPGMNETNLVVRLTSLTTLDLQRLLCTLFSKIVEFRYCTKKMERQAEEHETKYDQVKSRLVRCKRHAKQVEEECDSRVKEIIRYYNKDPGSDLGHYLRHTKTLKAARKKQYDLELCLTEILVRHHYLDNGADLHVKNVIDVLGIDPLKLKLYQMEDDDEEKKPVIPAELRCHLENQIPVGQAMSRRMRESYGHRRTHHTSGHDIGHENGHEHGHGHHGQQSSSSAYQHRHHHTNGHSSSVHPSSSKYKHKS